MVNDVVITASNQLQLILSDEVIEAVKNGQFHIYPVSHVEEAVELLMGCPAGSIDDDQTLFGRIRERLDDLNGSAREKWALQHTFPQITLTGWTCLVGSGWVDSPVQN